MLTTFAFILTPLLFQEPVLQRHPLERPAESGDQGLDNQIQSLSTTNWQTIRRLERTIFDRPFFPEKELLEAMNSGDPQMRANAFIVWNSPFSHEENNRNGESPELDPLPLFMKNPLDPTWDILIRQLKNDQIRMNKTVVMHAFWKNHELAHEVLLRSLTELDEQAYSSVLRILLYEQYNDSISQLDNALLNELKHYPGYHYEGFRSRGWSRFFPSVNQAWLTHHGERLYPMLKKWLLGKDIEKSAIAAHVFACRQWNGHDELVSNRLIEHLRSDDRIRNGNSAAKALLLFGNRAVPFLEKYVDDEDSQLQTYARLLLIDIQNPPRNIAELRLRKRLIPSIRNICNHCFDPILEHLGPAYYYPYDCKLDPHHRDELQSWEPCKHYIWELSKSKCPCGSHGCEIKIKEMGDVEGKKSPLWPKED